MKPHEFIALFVVYERTHPVGVYEGKSCEPISEPQSTRGSDGHCGPKHLQDTRLGDADLSTSVLSLFAHSLVSAADIAFSCTACDLLSEALGIPLFTSLCCKREDFDASPL